MGAKPCTNSCDDATRKKMVWTLICRWCSLVTGILSTLVEGNLDPKHRQKSVKMPGGLRSYKTKKDGGLMDFCGTKLPQAHLPPISANDFHL